MFMSSNPPARRTLADIIHEKITEKQTEIQSQMSGTHALKLYQKCSGILPDFVRNMFCGFFGKLWDKVWRSTDQTCVVIPKTLKLVLVAIPPGIQC